MPIIIQNVSSNPNLFGEHEYEVRINQQVICRFTHRREEGLARCLLAAAKAVGESQWQAAVAEMQRMPPWKETA